MNFDLNKGVSWIENGVEMPITLITNTPNTPGNIPKIFYPNNEGLNQVDSLKANGFEVILNDNNSIVVNATDAPLLLGVFSANIDPVDLSLGKFNFISWQDNGLTLSEPLERFDELYQIIQNEDLEGIIDPLTVSDVRNNEGMVVGFVVQLMPAGSGISLPPEIILLTNRTPDNNGFLITHDSDVTLNSVGPTDGVEVISETEASVCLSPVKAVESTLESPQSKCIKLEGCFAVEINGVMVPHYFKAEDLPRYFNASNEHGVQFLSCVIKCVPSEVDVWRQEQQEIEGGWIIDYSFDDGPIQQWSQVDMPTTWYTDLFDTMVNEMFTSSAPAGVEFVGGGGGVSNFQVYQSKLLGAEGGESEVAHKVSFHRQSQSSGALDLFEYFFGQIESGDRLDVTSCGTVDFPGY